MIRLALALLLAAGAAQAKTLVYCSEGAPDTFNPMFSTSGTTFDAVRPMMETLLTTRPGTAELAPALAESWDVSPDGLRYTFHLRRHVPWHAGARFKPTREFGADDVMFSFDRQRRDDSPFHAVSGGNYSEFDSSGLAALVTDVEKLDEATVRFTLARPHAAFLDNLSQTFTSIQSAEYADAMMKAGKPETIDQEPVGTGPFQFVAYQRDGAIRYKAFDRYWGGRPKLDALVFSITKDPAVRLAKLRADECQVAAYPGFADLPGIRADPDLKLASVQAFNIGYLALNTTKPPFDDKRVRRAITLAIDKAAILSAVYQGEAAPATTLLPPGSWAFDKGAADPPYDPEAARRQLAEAGHPDGIDIDLWAMPVQRPYNPDPRRVAELMQSDLGRAGIRAKIVSFEWGEYLKRAKKGDGQAVQIGWTAGGDPDDFFSFLFTCAAARNGGPNTSKWCNSAYDTLVEKAVETPDAAERKRLYAQAEAMLREEAPAVLVAHASVFTPMRKDVEGFVISPVGDLRFNDVDLR